MKYSLTDGRVLVDEEPVARLEILPGELTSIQRTPRAALACACRFR
jgi:hypothetical protein